MVFRLITKMIFLASSLLSFMPGVSTNSQNSNYLVNKQMNLNIQTIPYDNAGIHNQWPYTGIGCMASKPGDKYVYMISSQGLYFYGSTHNKCYRNRRELTVVKYDIENEIIAGRLFLESHNVGSGSDDIRTCGITNNNILYGVGGNYLECPNNYNTQSSIVRIDLDTFTFKDRTLLVNIPGKVDLIPANLGITAFKFIHYPSTSILDDSNNLYLTFNFAYTGLWKLNIGGSQITFVSAMQKTFYQDNVYVDANGNTQNDQILMYMPYFTKMLYLKNDQKMYLVSESDSGDSMILLVDMSMPDSAKLANATIKTLTDVRNIQQMRYDEKNQRIFMTMGKSSSRLYQLNTNFDIIEIAPACGIDFLKIPGEFGAITNFELDHTAGFIYALASTVYQKTGVIRIKINNFEHDDENSMIKFEDQYYSHSQQLYPISFANVSFIKPDFGKIVVATSQLSYPKRLMTMDLLGCIPGRGATSSNRDCQICPAGSYSNEIGAEQCKLCGYGHSTQKAESIECEKCNPGHFANINGSSSCFKCERGKYTETSGTRNCNLCVAGKYSLTEGSDSLSNCLPCEAGKISSQGSDNCQICPVGTFSEKGELCKECPKGKYNNIQGIGMLKQCKECAKGRYGTIAGYSDPGQCEKCPKGKYSLIMGATSNITCYPCEVGKYRGEIMNPGAECIVCETGKYADVGFHECLQCPKGEFIFEKRECTKCPKGRYSSTVGILSASECSPCLKGKYNRLMGKNNSESCRSCPTGKYGKKIGSDNPADCLPCTAGKYRGINDDVVDGCKICQPGKFSPRASNNCTLCDAGKYSTGTEALDFINCKECPGGKFRNSRGGSSLADCVDCPMGKYSDAGSSICKPCAIGKYNNIPSAENCKKCEAGKFTSTPSTINCGECPDFSTESNEGNECLCDPGSYEIIEKDDGKGDGKDNEKKIKKCLGCPNHATCKKNSNIFTMAVEPGYWRSDEESLGIFPCRVAYGCLGGSIKNSSNDLCNKGHYGPLCDVCYKGWAKNEGKCFECTEGGKNMSYFITILFPMIAIAVLVFMIKTANPTTEQKEPLSGVIKIFMNYAQIFSLASAFEINWPGDVRVLFRTAKDFSSPRVSFYSSDCTIGWNYYNKLFLYLTLPVFFIVISWGILRIIACQYEKERNRIIEKRLYLEMGFETKQDYTMLFPPKKVYQRAWTITTIVVGTFLMWPTIIKQSLTIFGCVKYGEKYYLIEDLSIECYDTTHSKYLYTCGLALIVYGMGIPIIGYSFLYKYRYHLYDSKNKYENATPLSFLFLGYRNEVWYYEFIVMAKKMFLIMISVFLRNFSRYQMICASLLIQIAFFLHVFLRPYDNITRYGILCNQLESISLLALVVTLNSGLFFGTIEDNYELGGFEAFLIVMLFLMNVAVVIMFLYHIANLVLNIMENNVKGLTQKMLSNPLEDDEENQLFNDSGKIGIKNRASVLPVDNIMLEKSKLLIPKNNCVVKILGSSKVTRLLEWSQSVKEDTHGINLKTDSEKIMFKKFYRVRNDFSKNITQKIRELETNENVDDYIKPFNRIKYEIENIVKNRYWYAIQTNRLFIELREIISSNNKRLELEEIEWLENIYNQYVENGVEYNNHLDDISQKALKDMEFQKKMRRMSTAALRRRNTHLLNNMVISGDNVNIPSVRGFALGKAESIYFPQNEEKKEEILENIVVNKTTKKNKKNVKEQIGKNNSKGEGEMSYLKNKENASKECREVLDEIILKIIQSNENESKYLC